MSTTVVPGTIPPSSTTNTSTTHFSVAILLFMLLVLVIVAIVIFETYRSQTFIFAPYVPPTPPSGTFYPLGEITPLTPDEIATRNAIIQDALNNPG